MAKAPRAWTDMDIDDLRSGIAHDESFEDIAELMMRDVEEVKRKAVELGFVESLEDRSCKTGSAN
jgi:hypothetical protein